MSKIYVVTKGDYSDYHIIAICSTEEKAKECLINNQGRYDVPEIETYELDVFKKCPLGLLPFGVKMDKNGNSEVERESIEYFEEGWKPYGDNKNVYFNVFAKDKNHAVKIANEKGSYLLANNLWEANWERWREKKGNKIIINPFKLLDMTTKAIILVITLYSLSQVYEGWLLKALGIMGIIWIIGGFIDLVNTIIIKEKIERLENETM